MVTKDDILSLAAPRKGNCVSLLLSTHRCWPESNKNRIRFENLLADVMEQLSAMDTEHRESDALTKPIAALLRDTLFWKRQQEGLAVYAGPQMFKTLRVSRSLPCVACVNNAFYIKPLLPILSDGPFYVLVLHQGGVVLFEIFNEDISPLSLPDLPHSRDAALRTHDHEYQIQFRTQTPGGSHGRRAALFHGQGRSSKEFQLREIRRFLEKVRKPVERFLSGKTAPLVLVGTETIQGHYHAMSRYPHLLCSTIADTVQQIALNDLKEQARNIVEDAREEQRREILDLYEQERGRGRTLQRLRSLLPAAYGGRVRVLLLQHDKECWGRFTAESGSIVFHDTRCPGDYGLLDYAARQVLLHGGMVYTFNEEHMPDGAAAAILRY